MDRTPLSHSIAANTSEAPPGFQIIPSNDGLSVELVPEPSRILIIVVVMLTLQTVFWSRVSTGLTAEQTGGGSSVVEDCKVQLAQACRIGDRLNLDDLVVPDREIEDEEQMSTRRHNSCHGSIHESRSCALSTY